MTVESRPGCAGIVRSRPRRADLAGPGCHEPLPSGRGGPALVPAGRLLRGASSAGSSTATTTGSGTSPGSSPSSTTSSGSASTASGCSRSTRRRCATAATTSATTTRCTPRAARSTTSGRLLDEAHARGIRVIADLVINHTSDQHPWFVESRQSRDNPKADWYVWNDDDQRWPEARVVFVDVERSNWSYDPQRDQYYWHRFYSHQPDLNYDNPEVADAMLDVVRFWLDLGPRRLPARRGALPLPAGRDRRGEPARDPRLHPAGPGRARRPLPGPDPAGRGQRVAGRRGRLLRGRRRVPSLLQLPADAPAVHGRPPRAELSRSPRSWPRPPRPPGAPVGHLPAQPRRADPRDGDRGGARLPVRRVRQGPPDEAPHGDRPPPRPAARPRPPALRAPLLPAVHPAGQPGPLLRGRDPDGGQPLPGRPRLGAHPDAVDPRPQRRASAGPTSPSSTCRR